MKDISQCYKKIGSSLSNKIIDNYIVIHPDFIRLHITKKNEHSSKLIHGRINEKIASRTDRRDTTYFQQIVRKK